MSNILLLETATPVCSVALAKDGKTIALKEENAPNIHASKLTLFIQEVMKEGGLAFENLDAIAVSKGPGSYTGLRIGVSTAKGLCFALDKPLIAIDTLKMMAAGFVDLNPNYKGLICPMIDARRMEVFTSLFNAGLEEVESTQAKIIDEKSYKDWLVRSEITFIGDGSSKCKGVITDSNVGFDDLNYNSASNMSFLSHEALTRGQFEDVAYFEPFYLKDFVFTVPKKK